MLDACCQWATRGAASQRADIEWVVRPMVNWSTQQLGSWIGSHDWDNHLGGCDYSIDTTFTLELQRRVVDPVVHRVRR